LAEGTPERISSSKTRDIPSNTVFIGEKPVKSYANAIVKQIDSGTEQVSVKARGRVISKAVDVAEVTKRIFKGFGNIEIVDVSIGTEALGESGRKRNVSTIEIQLAKMNGHWRHSKPRFDSVPSLQLPRRDDFVNKDLFHRRLVRLSRSRVSNLSQLLAAALDHWSLTLNGTSLDGPSKRLLGNSLVAITDIVNSTLQEAAVKSGKVPLRAKGRTHIG
jgi:DNA-binding protein